jgi:iron(III) transport system substrate-binding protein
MRESAMQAVYRICALAVLAGAVLPCGCERQGEAEKATVVVYTALDRQFSEPILAEFTAKTGIKVDAVYDTEATKTVGLVNRIRAEAGRPRCDVFWNNEILNTLRLKEEGLLQPCQPEQARHYAAEYRDPEGYWYGFAARARVIIVNTDLVVPADRPSMITDLANPRWCGQVGIAKPLFGTTASHVACLFATMGDKGAKALLSTLRANDVQVVAGNKTCAEMVAAGRLAFGLTDTDDAIIELDAGRPVAMVYPDAGKGQMGTLLLPNTLALVKGCRNPQGGARLIDYLLSPEVEDGLAVGPSAQIPLHAESKAHSRAGRLSDIRPMRVDFAAAAQAFERAAKYIEKEFLAP